MLQLQVWIKRKFGVKSIKFELLKSNVKSSTVQKGLLTDESMTTNLEKLSKLIGMSDLEASNKRANLSKDSINSGAEMFLSLNLCPPDFVKWYARAEVLVYDILRLNQD